jgi:hypothetical protein
MSGLGSGASAPNWDGVLQDMISAASGAASGNWQSAEDYSVTEFKKLAATGQLILQGPRDGSIPPAQGQILLDAQKNQSLAIIASVHLMNAVQAQAIVNAAVGVLTSAINAAIGMIRFF